MYLVPASDPVRPEHPDGSSANRPDRKLDSAQAPSPPPGKPDNREGSRGDPLPENTPPSYCQESAGEPAMPVPAGPPAAASPLSFHPVAVRFLETAHILALSCVASATICLGRFPPRGRVNAWLRGQASEERRFQLLSTLPEFGVFEGLPKKWIDSLLEQLVETELVEPRPSGTASLTVDAERLAPTDLGREVLRGNEPPPPELAQAPPRPVSRRDPWTPEQRELLEVLKRLRRKLASDHDLPSYCVFTNATLADLARHRPRTLGELPAVYGMGATRIQRWGEEIIRALRQGDSSDGARASSAGAESSPAEPGQRNDRAAEDSATGPVQPGDAEPS